MVIQLFPVTEALSRHLSDLAKTVYTVEKKKQKKVTGQVAKKHFLFLFVMKGITSL